MFCVLPATFKPVAGYEKLLQKVGSGSTFCHKICTCARFTGPRQTCFAAGYVTPAYGVTRAQFYPIRSQYSRNMQQPLLVSRQA